MPALRRVLTREAGSLHVCAAHERVLRDAGEILDGSPSRFPIRLEPPMPTDTPNLDAARKALALVSRYTPCAHESHEEAGAVWAKCADCGDTFTLERAPKYKAQTDAFDAALASIHAALAHIDTLEARIEAESPTADLDAARRVLGAYGVEVKGLVEAIARVFRAAYVAGAAAGLQAAEDELTRQRVPGVPPLYLPDSVRLIIQRIDPASLGRP